MVVMLVVIEVEYASQWFQQFYVVGSLNRSRCGDSSVKCSSSSESNDDAVGGDSDIGGVG